MSPQLKHFCIRVLNSKASYRAVIDEETIDIVAADNSTTDSGVGVYSFSGGNVTYYGLSLGSTATYSTSGVYICSNGNQILKRRWEQGYWIPEGITSKAGE